jgi:SAM-dependent methyltransferase
VRALAEQLPFGARAFDLVSVALTLHWLDRIAFLREASRVLGHGGWLLVYDSGFCGTMRENPSFTGWAARFRARFPAPPRNAEPLTPEFVGQHGFLEGPSEEFVHVEVYDIEQLMSYLTTQSNVLFALREGRETWRSAREWLRTTLDPIFTGAVGTFEYAAWLRLFRKAG